MPKGLKRYFGQGHLHFLTFSCYRRLPLLGTLRMRNLFVKILGELREQYRFRLVGYVVMPDHVHLLLNEPESATPSKVLQVLKQRVSPKARGKRRRGSGMQLRINFPGETAELRQFWQRRFYDFNVWSQKKIKEKLDYMHVNPVKRALVDHPKDWPWSSWLFYAKGEKRLVSIDPPV